MKKQATRHEPGAEKLQIVATVTLQEALCSLGLSGSAPPAPNDATL